jgi:hypothetical protein
LASTCFYLNSVQIWSHRTHTGAGGGGDQDSSSHNHSHHDSGVTRLFCRQALESLHQAQIRHFDVDVLVDRDTGRLLVAHPGELLSKTAGGTAAAAGMVVVVSNNATHHHHNHPTFRKAPCSNLDLHEFVALLRQVYADVVKEDNDDDNNDEMADSSSPRCSSTTTTTPFFFVTMEPKANWPGQVFDPLLIEPKIVMDRLLEQIPQSFTEPCQCGIILSPVQLEFLQQQPQQHMLYEASYHDRLRSVCHHLVFPLSIRSPYELPQSPPYTMFMPTIEHHGSLLLSSPSVSSSLSSATTAVLAHRTLQPVSRASTTTTTIPTVVWIVDDREQLLLALQLQQQQQQQEQQHLSLQGIITNRPLQMQLVLREVCGTATTPTTTT